MGGLLASAVASGQNVLLCPDPTTEEEACEWAWLLKNQFGKRAGRDPGVALTTDATLLCEVGERWSEEEVLTKQVEGLADRLDLLVVLAAEEPSDDLIAAVTLARSRHLSCMGILKDERTSLIRRLDTSLIVPDTIPQPATLRRRAWKMIVELAASIIRDRTLR
jgi:D-sedoheptulose 7-phosphate isomerase